MANSWVSTGQNLPISPEQLGSALGADAVGNMASQLGMGQAARTLARAQAYGSCNSA